MIELLLIVMVIIGAVIDSRLARQSKTQKEMAEHLQAIRDALQGARID
jgi:uncharacterized membrane-anchored protein YhcB (DUF1043 family)